MTTKAREIAEQLDPDNVITQTKIRAMFNCSNRTAKQAYKLMGWKSQKEIREDKLQEKINDIALKIKNISGMSKSMLAERFGVTNESMDKAYAIAGIDPPAFNANSTKETWPQEFDSMNGMDSLNLLKRAWV